MARVQVLVDDLMLSSKVNETLGSAGHELLGGPVPNPEAELRVPSWSDAL